jgi:hypothetical protein
MLSCMVSGTFLQETQERGMFRGCLSMKLKCAKE